MKRNPLLFDGPDPRHIGRVQVDCFMVSYDRVDACWRREGLGSLQEVESAKVAQAIGVDPDEIHDWENAMDLEFEREIDADDGDDF